MRDMCALDTSMCPMECCTPCTCTVQVHQLQIAAVLQGAHKSSPVTAVKWSPDAHSRDLKSASHLRLASGDAEGVVVVWDVLTQTVVATLDESTTLLSPGPAASRSFSVVR